MVKYEFTNLKEFFDKIKKVGFIERLFFWRNILSLSYDAYKEFRQVDYQLQAVNDELSKARGEVQKKKR